VNHLRQLMIEELLRRNSQRQPFECQGISGTADAPGIFTVAKRAHLPYKRHAKN
jgi:hypothetical protein